MAFTVGTDPRLRRPDVPTLCPYGRWRRPRALPKTVILTNKRRCRNDECDLCTTREYCCSSCEAEDNGTLLSTSAKHDPWCRGEPKFKALFDVHDCWEAVENRLANCESESDTIKSQPIVKKRKLDIKHNEQTGTVQHSSEYDRPSGRSFSTSNVTARVRRCYLEDHQFRTPEGKMVGSADLSKGSKVLDFEGTEVEVTWCAVHSKAQRLFVDLHTRSTMLTVTDSHRIVVPHGRDIEAAALKKGDEVLNASSSRVEKLQKVTKRYGYAKVVELEFEGDPTIAVWLPSILTKGADPSAPFALDPSINCKEEPGNNESAMASTTEFAGDGARTNEGPMHSDTMESTEFWPDTEDEFS